MDYGLSFLAACVNEYFNDTEMEETQNISPDQDPIYKGFKAVLDSKSHDETMVSKYLVFYFILFKFSTNKLFVTFCSLLKFRYEFYH